MSVTYTAYAIRNTVTGEWYVGMTRDPGQRFKAHRSALDSGRHTCGALQTAWAFHGPDAFAFEELEQLEVGVNPRTRETYWIDIARSEAGVYNTRLVSSYGAKDKKKPRRPNRERMQRIIEESYRKPLRAVIEGFLMQPYTTYAQMASRLGVSMDTLRIWRRQIEAQRADSTAAHHAAVNL